MDTIERRQERDKETVLQSLREMPIVFYAVKKSGISRATYYRWLNDDPSFRALCNKAMDEGVDQINDISESQLVTLIKEKKMPAISLWLRKHHPKYKERAEMRYRPEEKHVDLIALVNRLERESEQDDA